MSSRPLPRPSVLIWVLTAELWAIAVLAWIAYIRNQFGGDPFRSWLLDWHVYAAGSRDFLSRDLYHVPLESTFPIPVSSYNMPPASAVITLPFITVPDTLGGTLWVLLNVAATAGAAILAARIMRWSNPWLWAGALFFAYTVTNWSLPALLGNNTPLLLLLVASFVAVHLAGRPVAAGVLLGVAIAIKLWPATFLVVLARERDWRTFGWAIGVAAVITIPLLLWLGGPGVIGPMIAALQVRDDIGPKQVIFGITWLRENVSWWPDWGGYAISFLILLIPARGLTGYGLATLAGMAAIPNLWRHYWPTVVFGVLLVGRGLLDRRQARAGKRPHARPAGATPRVGETATDPEFGS